MRLEEAALRLSWLPPHSGRKAGLSRRRTEGERVASDADATKLRSRPAKRAGVGLAPVEAFSRLTGLDSRLLAMMAALVVIWIVLDLWTGGLFLTPRNLFNLAVPGSAVGIMATGMVFVIVARPLDPSVGSVLGFVGMSMAFLQVEVFPLGAAWNWPLSIACGLALVALAGLWPGLWVALGGVPARSDGGRGGEGW